MNMNAGIKKTVKDHAACLEYQQTQPHKETIPYEVPCKPWEVVGTDFILLNITNFYVL